MNVFIWNAGLRVQLQNKFKVTWFVFILMVGFEAPSDCRHQKGQPAPPRASLAPFRVSLFTHFQ